jgi:fermentation-respiration switch protein FrsA (DUF1100 family)
MIAPSADCQTSAQRSDSDHCAIHQIVTDPGTSGSRIAGQHELGSPAEAAGLTNWISFAGTIDIPHEMALVHWNSWWFDEPELHWERSLLAHLDRPRTPTLIVHGTADDRVHPEQSLELYTALRIKKVPTQLVFYPREPHGLNERTHQLDFVMRVLEWFDRHLAGPASEESQKSDGS